MIKVSRSVTSLETSLKIKFKDPNLLRNSLVHRSYINESPDTKLSNERLEFLGDSVLSVLVSTELYNRFPNHPEGKLTALRSLLVKAKTLADLAKQIGLGEHLLMSRGEERSGGRQNMSLLADTFEAVIGALYLDQGLPAVDKLLEKVLYPLISEIEQKEDLLDYKSNLQEVIQERDKVSPLYKVLSESGPDHDKTFTIGVYVGEAYLGKAEGKSKQSAEQQAAKVALESIKL